MTLVIRAQYIAAKHWNTPPSDVTASQTCTAQSILLRISHYDIHNSTLLSMFFNCSIYIHININKTKQCARTHAHTQTPFIYTTWWIVLDWVTTKEDSKSLMNTWLVTNGLSLLYFHLINILNRIITSKSTSKVHTVGQFC